MPPAEPPPQATLPGLALNCVTRSFIDWIFDDAGTTITSYSPVRRAIGVTCDSLTGDLLVTMAPTITMPPTISALRIALLRVHELRDADGAAGAALVVDLHLRNELALLHRGLQRAPGLVPAAARVGGHEDLQAVEGERGRGDDRGGDARRRPCATLQRESGRLAWTLLDRESSSLRRRDVREPPHSSRSIP